MATTAIKKKQSGLGTAAADGLPARKRSVSIEQAIAIVGEFGLAQKLQILLCALTQAAAALITVHVVSSSMFLSSEARSWLRCVDPSGSEASEEAHTACNDVLSSSSSSPSPSSSSSSSSSVGRVRSDVCGLPRAAWTYSGHGSLASDFDLLCGREWVLYLAMTMYFVGAAAGTVGFAVLAERNQRRSILNLGRVVAGLASMLIATSPVLWLVLVFRFFLGVGVSLMTMAAYVLSYDVTGTSWRPYVAVFLQAGYGAGGAAGAFLVWLVPQWRVLGFVIGLVPIVMAVTTWKYLVESPSWLLFQGRKGEATSAVASLAFGNRTRPPDSPLADPVNMLANPRRKLVDIIKNGRLLLRIALVGFAWVAVTVAYFGVLASYDAIGMMYTPSAGAELAFSGFLYELVGVAVAALAVDGVSRVGVTRARSAAAFTGATAVAMFAGAFSLLGGTSQAFRWFKWCTVASRLGAAGSMVTVLVLAWEAYPSIVAYSGVWLLHALSSALVASAPWLAFSAYLLRSAFVEWITLASLCGGACVAILLFDGAATRRFLTIQEEDEDEERQLTMTILTA